MEFIEAVQHLLEGKKIRRKAWDNSLYLINSPGENIKCYRQEAVNYSFDLEIIESLNWIIDDEKDLEVPFAYAIKPLLAGKKARMSHWPNDCYIQSTPNGKEIYLTRIAEYNFTPTFECFASNDWEILE